MTGLLSLQKQTVESEVSPSIHFTNSSDSVPTLATTSTLSRAYLCANNYSFKVIWSQQYQVWRETDL